jgi:hypothetical protein
MTWSPAMSFAKPTLCSEKLGEFKETFESSANDKLTLSVSEFPQHRSNSPEL